MTTGTYTGTYSVLEIRQSPAGLTASGRVDNNSVYGAAVFEAGGGSYSIFNDGVITAAAQGDVGVRLTGGSSLDNAGSIAATGLNGVGVYAVSGTLTNTGLVQGLGSARGGVQALDGAVVNYGVILGSGFGVYLGSGSIANAGTIAGGNLGIQLANGVGANTGLIEAQSSTGVGVYLRTASTATIVPSFTNGASGTIEGDIGVKLTAGSLGNAGVIIGQAYAVGLVGATTLTNSGTVLSIGPHGLGADLLGTGSAGAVLVNEAGALIESTGSGGDAVIVQNLGSATGIGQVANSGTIRASGARSVGLYLADAVGTNATGALVEGALGVLLGGTLSPTFVNQGTVTGSNGIALEVNANSAALVEAAPGAVFNGKILGNGSSRLELLAGSGQGSLTGIGFGVNYFGLVSVDPQAHWTLSGTNLIAAGTTLLNAGTLVANGTINVEGTLESAQGASGVALKLGGGLNKLVVNPDAVITGSVGGSGVNELELAAGTTSGTFSGLGSAFTNFASVSLDWGGFWDFTGSNRISAGETLKAFGTLKVPGTLAIDGGKLVDHTMLKGRGTVELSNGGRLRLEAGSGIGTIAFLDGTGTLKIDEPAATFSTIEGLRAGDKIDLLFVGYSRTNYSPTLSGNVLSLVQYGVVVATLNVAGIPAGSTLVLSNDGTGGTLIQVQPSGSAAAQLQPQAAVADGSSVPAALKPAGPASAAGSGPHSGAVFLQYVHAEPAGVGLPAHALAFEMTRPPAAVLAASGH